MHGWLLSFFLNMKPPATCSVFKFKIPNSPVIDRFLWMGFGGLVDNFAILAILFTIFSTSLNRFFMILPHGQPISSQSQKAWQ